MLVKQYDGEFPTRFFVEVLNYLDMNLEDFFETIDKFRSQILWEKISEHKWKMKYTIN